jgi:hypothetical protein
MAAFEGAAGSSLWFAKTCDKPSFTIETAEHQYLNHTFYYPGSVKWQAISMTLVDPGDPDTVGLINSIVQQSNYAIPGTPSELTTMSKGAAVSSIGTVTVQQLDAAGVALETWTLNNAFITEAKFGSLEYGSDDLTTVDLTLQYDWAQCELKTAAPTAAGGTDFYKMA